MSTLMASADNLLSKIPFDGDKTAIGAGLHVLLPLLIAYVPAIAMAGDLIDGIAMSLVAVGLVHKGVKKVSGRGE